MPEEMRTKEEKIALIDKSLEGFKSKMRERMVEKVDEKFHWQDWNDKTADFVVAMMLDMTTVDNLINWNDGSTVEDIPRMRKKLVDLANRAMMAYEMLEKEG